jgi:tetratricopeptide (TPR) repeat protein
MPTPTLHVDDAIATYNQGLQALPNNAQLQLLLALAYEAKGDTADAKQTYQDILTNDPNNTAATTNLDRLNVKH